MSDYGFTLDADQQKQYDENKAAVDAELDRLVKEQQNARLEESGSLGFSEEQHRALFDQALNNVTSGTAGTTEPSLIRPTNVTNANEPTSPVDNIRVDNDSGNTGSKQSKTTSYNSTSKAAKGK